MEASGVPKPSKHFTSQLIPAKEWSGQSVFLLHSLTDSFLNEKIYLYMLHITVPGQSVYSGELKNLNLNLNLDNKNYFIYWLTSVLQSL